MGKRAQTGVSPCLADAGCRDSDAVLTEGVPSHVTAMTGIDG